MSVICLSFYNNLANQSEIFHTTILLKTYVKENKDKKIPSTKSTRVPENVMLSSINSGTFPISHWGKW